MRLKKTKSNDKNYLSKIPQNHHHPNKNISMDQISPKADINQSVYLHKILVKNLGEQTPESNFPNFKENIENFQSSIQNIFSNEENRQRAMKYVINMRSKRTNLSPFEINDERRNEKNNNININNINIFSKTINDGFYDTTKYNKNYLSNNKVKPTYKSRDNKINQRIKFKPYNGFNIYSNNLDQFISENSLIKDKKNKLYEEYQSNRTSNNKINNNSANNNIYLTNINSNSNTKGKIPKDLSSYANARTTKDNNNNNNNNNKIFYRKKKFSKNENLFIDSKPKHRYNKYRYIEDDNDNNDDSDLNNNNNNFNNNNNYENKNYMNINELTDSDEIKYEQTFDNNANNNKLKEIVIDNINDLYQNQK